MQKVLLVATVLLFSIAVFPATDIYFALAATDPGVRGGLAGAGGAIANLNPFETQFFTDGLETFSEVDSVSGTVPDTGAGLGPRFNLDSCAGCHAQPATGGTSPFVNPQVAVATREGALNTIPFFITPDGPVREARFILNPNGTLDGGVHNLFTITGRSDATGCLIAQPDFDAAARKHNLIFRIPTPVFGAGLIENIPEEVILANKIADLSRKTHLKISGHENRNGNDGTITRFGWKAQNKSPLIFAGEAYNVEQGVSNELFTQERDETQGCVFNPIPEDHTNFAAIVPLEFPSDAERFSFFMRFLAAPEPAPATLNTVAGQSFFKAVGCNLCHTPQLQTATTTVAALSNQNVNLFSDLLVHSMGIGLADGIIQGKAGPAEFRTAPLWGVGQRIFFLHDGRTKDLLVAIQAHKSIGSEANQVINNFNNLADAQKQSVLNFLRSL